MTCKLLYLAYAFLYNCPFVLSQPYLPHISVQTPFNGSRSFLQLPELTYFLVPLFIENIVSCGNALSPSWATAGLLLPVCELEMILHPSSQFWGCSDWWLIELLWEIGKGRLCCAEAPISGTQGLVSWTLALFQPFQTPLLGPRGQWAVALLPSSHLLLENSCLFMIGLYLEFLPLIRPMVLILRFDRQSLRESEESCEPTL